MKLSPAQRRGLELLKTGGGYCHVFDGNLMRIFRALRDKGFVEIKAGYGQLQRGYHVYLKEQKIEHRAPEKPKLERAI